MNASPSLESEDIFAGIRVIDTDTHLSEPHDLWTSRAPASYQDLVPHVRTVDGQKRWMVNKDVVLGPATPASAVRKNSEKARGISFFRFQMEDVHEASYV